MRAAAFFLALLLVIAAPPRAAAVTLAEALTADVLPPSSARCISGGALSSTSATFNFRASPNGTWDKTAAPWESAVFLAELAHTDTDLNRSWCVHFLLFSHKQ
jgi:hypothetical protein